MRILVTGGAGFIGSHLIDRLVSTVSGNVIVVDNFSRGQIAHLDHLNGGVKMIEGDIRDRPLLTQHMSGIDIVFHLAAQSNVLDAASNPDYAFETNVLGTYEVLRAAARSGVKRIVFTSSREIYGDSYCLPVKESIAPSPKNAYGASKAAGELYCGLFRGTGVEVVILRLANVYGPRDRGRVIPIFSEQALRGEPLTVFGDDKIIDFIWIRHVVDVLVRAATVECPPTPVNVGSGKGTNLIDLANTILKLANRPDKALIAENRRPEVNRFVADVTFARQHLGLPEIDNPLEYLPVVFEVLEKRLKGCAASV
jgi:UDP-glucose 4-epimerase